MRKRALGIFVDDNLLKTALLTKEGETIQIDSLETFQLFELLERREAVTLEEGGEKHVSSGGDFAFGAEIEADNVEKLDSDDNESTSNLDVVINLINRIYSKGTAIAFNLLDSFTLYKMYPSLTETQPKKIKKSIWQDMNPERASSAKFENISYTKLDSTGYLATVHEDPLMLSDLFFEAAKMMRINPPSIQLIDTIDCALAHEICQTVELDGDVHTGVLLFSSNYTKIFFMHGQYIEMVLPTIHEGSDSRTICDTAFSKILFELDSGKIAALNKLILVGDIDRVSAQEFFEQRMPSVEVQRYEAKGMELGPHVEVIANQVPYYGMALALARKALEPRSATIYKTNFIPRRIKDKVYVYKVSWHGVVLLAILFASMMFLTIESVKVGTDIKLAKNANRALDGELASMTNTAVTLDSLKKQITDLKENTALIDSLTQNTTKWAELFERLSDAYAEIGPFCITKVETPTNKRLVAEMKVENREQVAKLERFIPKSIISNVYTAEENSRFITVKIECYFD